MSWSRWSASESPLELFAEVPSICWLREAIWAASWLTWPSVLVMLWTVCWLSVVRAVEVWLSDEVRLPASCTKSGPGGFVRRVVGQGRPVLPELGELGRYTCRRGFGEVPLYGLETSLLGRERALVGLLCIALLLQVLVAEALDARHLNAVAGQGAGTVVKAHVLDRADGAELDLFIDIPRRAGVGNVLAHRVHGRLLSLQPGKPDGEV